LKKREEGGVKEELIWEIKMGQSITNDEMKKAKDVYGEYAEWLKEIFNEFDVLALPSAQVYPFPIEERYPKTINDRTMDTYHRWMEVSVPVSFGGLPCMTIPAPLSPSPSEFGSSSSSSSSSRNDKDNNDKMSLPIGIQLFAKRGDDLILLKLANEYYHIIPNNNNNNTTNNNKK
jgi:amidase